MCQIECLNSMSGITHLERVFVCVIKFSNYDHWVLSNDHLINAYYYITQLLCQFIDALYQVKATGGSKGQKHFIVVFNRSQ